MKTVISLKMKNFGVVLALFLCFNHTIFAQTNDKSLAQPYYDQGKQAMDQEDYAGAISSFDEAIKQYPKFWEALEARGYCKMVIENDKSKNKSKDYTEAIKDYTDALLALDNEINKSSDFKTKKELRKAKVPIYINRAYAKMQYDTKKYYKLAIEDYNAAWTIDNSNMDIYIGRAYAYHKRKQFDREIQDYKIVVKEALEPNSKLPDKQGFDLSIIYFNMGNAYIDYKNDKKNACENYKKSLDLGYTEAKSKVMAHCSF